MDIVCLQETKLEIISSCGAKFMGLSTCGLLLFGIEKGFRRDFVNVG